VSQALARWRSARFGALRYELDFVLERDCETVRARLCLAFQFIDAQADLVLDWRPHGSAATRAVRADGVEVPVTLSADHLTIHRSAFAGSGVHRVEVEFDTPVAPAGTPLTRYRDREDGSELLYTLLVPADASALFPCMDQPDLKASFVLTLTVPHGWNAVANAPVESVQGDAPTQRLRFAPTPPISTYLFAFAAGPFEQLGDDAGGRLLVRRSQHARARRDADAVMQLNRDCVRWFEAQFGHPFPFPKYDLVLIPEFPYAGMEHAGATFLREDSVLFVAEPAEDDVLRRAQLIFHEAAHQWFGNLVTMRWFDDLWLKEGFANLMAYKAARALLPHLDARIAWHRSKEIAYETDATAGTTAVYQPLDNLSLASNAYGNVVYHKAPAVLELAEALLGESVFREAIRDFLTRHAFGAADRDDLVAALERAAGRDLRAWAREWILQPGMPRIDCTWSTDAETALTSLALTQSPVCPQASVPGASWPQRVQVVLGKGVRASAVVDGIAARGTSVLKVADLPAPDWVFANASDQGYGWFALDPRSRAFLLAHLPELEDSFLRTLLWEALWQSVRDAEVAPRAWIDLVLRGLPGEPDALTVSALLVTLKRALRWYLDDAGRDAVQQRVEETLRRGALSGEPATLRVAYLRAFAAVARTRTACDDCAALLSGTLVMPGVSLREADRFRLVRSLLALGDARGDEWLARLAREGGDDARRMAFAAQAARPGAGDKAATFERLLDPALPERWVAEAAAAFNVVEHEDATLPHLRVALRALPALVRRRRIFFANQWLAAFVGGQRGVRAAAEVQGALSEDVLPDALRRKLLEVHDGLARSVRIRERFGAPADG